ncbi:MAG: porin family protein [Cyclobacteriaceae bacterium]|jgi:hypothetical protein|nr:porin family protein [Cyclobacteriaceae bacterium]
MKFINIKTIGTVVLMTLVSISAFSQSIFREGFIVKKERQDTVHGFIKLLGSVHEPSFKFKTSKEATAIDLSPEEIYAIVIKDYRYFKTITVDADDKFAQALVEGEADLYLNEKKFYLEKDEKLSLLEIEQIEMEGAKKETAIHRKKTYVGILKSSMNDCPAVWPLIDKSRLVESNLTSIVDEYNQCRNSPSLVFKNSIPLFKLSVDPFIAWSYSKLDMSVSQSFVFVFGYLEEANFSNFSLSPGVGFTLSSPRINDNFSFYTELRYIQNTFHDRVIYPKTTYDDNDITIQASYIYLPVTVKYSIPLNTFSSLYLKGGLLKTFLLSSNYKNVRRVSMFPNSPPLINENNFDFYSSQTGFTGSLGYEMRINKKLDGWVELRFDNTGPIINSTTVGFVQNVFSLVTAISF